MRRSVKLVIGGGILGILAYLGSAMHENYEVGRSYGPLLRALAEFRKQHSGWPKNLGDLKSYMDAPYATEAMNPEFKPISNERAYVYITDWSYLLPLRTRYIAVFDANGRPLLTEVASNPSTPIVEKQ